MLSINYPLAYNAVVGHAAHIPTRRPPRSAGVTIQGGRLMLDGQPLRLSWATFTNAAGVLKSTDAALRALRAQIVADGCNAMRIRAPNARYWTQSVGNYGIYKTASNDATVANRVLYEEAALVQLDRSIAWALDAGIELIYLDFEGYDQIALRGANQRAGGTYNSNGMWWSAEYRALWWAAMLPVLTRVNTITGTRYCDDKRIIWLFNNENGPSQTYLASKSAWGSSAQTGTTTSGSAVVTGLDTSVLRVGMGVTGTSGISSSLTIQSVDSVSQVTLTGNASASGSRTITFTAHHFDKIIEGIDDSTGANGYWNTELVSLLTAFAAANSWTLPAWGRGATPAGGGAQGFPRQYVWANWGTLTDRENLVAFIDDVEYNATVEMLDLMKALRDDIIVCPGTFLYQSPRCSLALPSRFDNNVITEVHDYAYSGAGIGVQTGAGTTRQSMLDRTWANVGNGYGWVNSVCGVRNLKTPLISGECGQYSPNRWRFERMYLEMLVSLSQGYSAVQYADCQQDTADQALNVGIGQTSDHVGTGSSCDRLVREALSPALRYGFLAEASASFTIYSTRASLLAAQKAALSSGLLGGNRLNPSYSGSGYENWVWADTKVYWVIDDSATPTTVWTTFPKVTDATLNAGTYMRNTGNGPGCEKVWVKRGDVAGGEIACAQWMTPYMAGFLDIVTPTPQFSQHPLKMSGSEATKPCVTFIRSDGLWPLFTGPGKLFIHGTDLTLGLVNRNSSYASSGGIGEATFLANDLQTVYYSASNSQLWDSGIVADQRQAMPEAFTLTIDTTNNGLNPAGTDLEFFGVDKDGIPHRIATSYDSGTKLLTLPYDATYPRYAYNPKPTSTVARASVRR